MSSLYISTQSISNLKLLSLVSQLLDLTPALYSTEGTLFLDNTIRNTDPLRVVRHAV